MLINFQNALRLAALFVPPPKKERRFASWLFYVPPEHGIGVEGKGLEHDTRPKAILQNVTSCWRVQPVFALFEGLS